MKKISIVSPCYNEQENIHELYTRVKAVMATLDGYEYEHILIDNHSTDQTIPILREIACEDPRVKVIINARNFGHIRSPFYGLLQARGDAVILVASDLQDPPEMIPDFIHKWEEGFKVVLGQKTNSEETPIFYFLRTLYYRSLQVLSETELIEHATGFGLYDQQVIEALRSLHDPYPYLRGLISELGFKRTTVPFCQPRRKRGITKNNFYTLYDIAMLGLTSHSKIPLRFAVLLGFGVALISAVLGFGYLIYKLLFWARFSVGSAPVVIGLFFFASVQLIFLGIVGEYVGAIYTQVLHRPLVIEEERINF